MSRLVPSHQDSPTLDLVIERIMAGPKHLDHAKGDMAMCVTTVHRTGCPLDLERMVAARDLDFWHDVLGILQHFDGRTKSLRGFFVPRFARPPEVTA